MPMQTFTKSERLSEKIALDRLFQTGKSFNCFPFKVVWKEVPEAAAPVQLVISVPKRIFKRAVDRNLVKRRIREAYRRHKGSFYESLGEKKLHVMLMYTAKTLPEYKDVEDKIISVLERLHKTVIS